MFREVYLFTEESCAFWGAFFFFGEGLFVCLFVCLVVIRIVCAPLDSVKTMF